MPQIDWRNELPHLYAPAGEAPTLVEVPTMNFVMCEGEGDPAGANFVEALETLRYLAFALKFNLAEIAPQKAFSVMPFEALIERDGETWRWTLMVMQPPVVTAAHFQATAGEIADAKMARRIGDVRLASFSEGLSAQILHLGPFGDGGASIRSLHELIESEGCEPAGLHHEIYLNDPIRTRPERRRTLLRQPVCRRG